MKQDIKIFVIWNCGSMRPKKWLEELTLVLRKKQKTFKNKLCLTFMCKIHLKTKIKPNLKKAWLEGRLCQGRSLNKLVIFEKWVLEGFFVCFCFLRMSAGGQGQEIPCCFSSHWEMLLGWEVPGTSHPGQGAP